MATYGVDDDFRDRTVERLEKNVDILNRIAIFLLSWEENRINEVIGVPEEMSHHDYHEKLIDLLGLEKELEAREKSH